MRLEIEYSDVLDGEIAMCDYCRTSPCLQGCPNEEHTNNLHICAECEESIYVGDKYLKVWRNGSVYRYHEDCGRFMLSLEELTNASVEIADYIEEDWW